MTTILRIGTSAILLLMGLFSAANAEYLIYLKGGHYIVADECTISSDLEDRKDLKVCEQVTSECKLAKGRISWTVSNRNNEIAGAVNTIKGEVECDDVYAIFGGKGLKPIKLPGTTLPLEDYLIANRSQGFVNSKDLPEEMGSEVHGRKRDKPVTLDRRSVFEIAPERLATTESGEGLCPKEPNEFTVRDIDLVGDHLVGVITNLSQTEWRPEVEVEIKAKGRLKGKFTIEDKNLLGPGEDVSFDRAIGGVESQHLKYLQDLKDPNTGIRICFRKVKTAANK